MIAIYARQSIYKADSISIETQIEDCKIEDPRSISYGYGYYQRKSRKARRIKEVSTRRVKGFNRFAEHL